MLAHLPADLKKDKTLTEGEGMLRGMVWFITSIALEVYLWHGLAWREKDQFWIWNNRISVTKLPRNGQRRNYRLYLYVMKIYRCIVTLTPLQFMTCFEHKHKLLADKIPINPTLHPWLVWAVAEYTQGRRKWGVGGVGQPPPLLVGQILYISYIKC